MNTECSAVSLVILSYNRLIDLQRNLSAWCAEDIPNFEIIVVDNASSDGSRDYLGQLSKEGKIRAILNDRNLGVAAGRNAGFRIAKGEIILCLDDDAYLAPSELPRVVRYFQQNQLLGALSLSVVHFATGQKQNPHGDKPVEVANYHGAAHALRTRALREIGFLDEACTFGAEEFDSCIRLYDKGYSCVYAPDIVAQHNSFLRRGDAGLNRACQWHYNYVRVLFKNFPSSMASLYANRLFIARLYHGLMRFGITGVIQLIKSDHQGRQDGKTQQKVVSERTIQFYSNPDLRPEFGNVPLTRKVLSKVRWYG